MRIRELHDNFGIEVLDMDILATSPHEIDELCAALDEHLLLLFRCKQPISIGRQVEIGSWFGPIVDDHRDGRYWMNLHNDNTAGRRPLPFHSDFTYTDTPAKRITLHALELPAGETSTSFANGIHAWATLPTDLQKELSSMTVRHVHLTKHNPEWPDFTADHPVCVPHPRTGQPILFVTEYHARRILELEAEESDRMITRLFAYLYAPAKVYEHRWQPYDLLIWDNMALQHARKAEADPVGGTRKMQRVALNQVPFADLVDRARKQ